MRWMEKKEKKEQGGRVKNVETMMGLCWILLERVIVFFLSIVS